MLLLLELGVPVVCAGGVPAGISVPSAGTDVPTPPGASVPLVLAGAVGTPIGTSVNAGAALGVVPLAGVPTSPMGKFEIGVGDAVVVLLLPLSHPTDTKAVKRESNTASNASFLENIFNSVMFLPENNEFPSDRVPVADIFPGAILLILAQCVATVKLCPNLHPQT